MSAQLHPAYRADIDGLRAVAVLSVVIYHAFPHWLTGGFVGVDIFFVISGYLISTIIFSNLERGSFSWADFYSRRVRRIFPSLALVLLACLAFGWFALSPEEYRLLGQHTFAGAAFFSNFQLQREAGYFDQAAELKPLLHLWSLGIEEQFYLVFPVLAFFAYRARRFRPHLLALSLALSFAAGLRELHHDPVKAFYLPWFRFWELLIGSTLAFATLRGFRARRPEWWSALGGACVLAAVFCVNRQSAFPGFWALLPSLGSAFLIAAGPRAWVNRVVLSRRVAIGVGLISYPLYLWHWPLLAFERVVRGGEPAAVVRGAFVIFSFLLAWLSYQFVEKPFRFGGGAARAKVTALCGAVALAGAGGLAVKRSHGVLARFPPELRQLLDVPETSADEWRRHECFLGFEDFEKGFAASCTDPAPAVFLWGDSHAAALYPGFRSLGVPVAQYTAAGCPPIPDRAVKGVNPLCNVLFRQVLARVTELRPGRVLLAGHWGLYPDWADVAKTVAALRAAGVKKIALVGPAPEWKQFLPKVLWSYWKRDLRHELPPLYSSEGLEARTAALNGELREFARREHVDYLSPYDVLCRADGCLTRMGAKLTSVDADHLTPEAAALAIRAWELEKPASP